MNQSDAMAYVEAARRKYEKEGEIEIDRVPEAEGLISRSEAGAYVKAWVWVYAEEAEREP
jgi:hypothetical protein